MDRRLWPFRNNEQQCFKTIGSVLGFAILMTVAITVDGANNQYPYLYRHLQHPHHHRRPHQGLQTSGMRAAKITEKFHIHNGNQLHHNVIGGGDGDVSGQAKNSMVVSPSSPLPVPPPPLPMQPRPTSPVDTQLEGLIILNRLVKESFLVPIFTTEPKRNGRRRIFADIPMLMRKVFRGLTNLTVAISRTIHSENGNGSLSRLITHRLVGVSESLMGWVERSVDDLPSIPRLDAQECMKRVICEAHNQPKKYGAVGLVIQLFFPPYLDVEDANKIVSKYQLAARYGRGENANCAAQYDDCMVNVLDLLQGAINMLF